MAYQKKYWINEESELSADDLNKYEDAFENHEERLEQLEEGGTGPNIELVDNLNEENPGKALDARQGKVLKDYIDSRSGGSSGRIFNVLDYGFDDTGVTTNDEVFIELYSNLKNGDTIYFPAGIYLFDDSITCNKNATIIKGEGPRSILNFNSGGIISDEYYQQYKNFTLRTKNTTSTGIKNLKSYCIIEKIYFDDYTDEYWNINIQCGDIGVGVWFCIYDKIYINSTATTTRSGTAFLMYSTVNNIINNPVIINKNICFDFQPDNSAGYGNDGCQIVNANITYCGTGIKMRESANIFISNSIFDQIVTLACDFNQAKSVHFNNCYISAGAASGSNFRILVCTNSEEITFTDCIMKGAPSSYGLVISNSKKIEVKGSTIGHFTNGISVDADSKFCDFSNIFFNELVTTKLFLNGQQNTYSNLKGYGAVTIYNGFQIADHMIYNTMNVTTGTGTQSHQFEIPLNTSLAKPYQIYLIALNTSENYIFTYMRNVGENITIRMHKLSGNFNGEQVLIGYSYPVILKQEAST